MVGLKPDPQFRNGYKDKKRLADIHQLPCARCYTKGYKQISRTIAHHKIGMGLGRKASDLLTMALCNYCHTGLNGIHAVPLHKWEEYEGLTQDDLILITNKMLENL